MGLGKKVFVRKGAGPNLYKWSPIPNNFERKPAVNSRRNYFCDARPNTQGQDWISTYSYNVVLVNNEQQRVAYVACDYVE
jgi:hypothetical protein